MSASSVRAPLPDRPCCHPVVLGATELQKSHEITVSAGLQPPFLEAPPKEASGQVYLTAPQLPEPVCRKERVDEHFLPLLSVSRYPALLDAHATEPVQGQGQCWHSRGAKHPVSMSNLHCSI